MNDQRERHRRRNPVVRLAMVAATLPFLAGAEPVRKSDLVEKTSRHLVAIDVTVLGPREIAAQLQAADFQLTVAGREIQAFSADSACPAPSAEPEEAPIAVRPPTILYYFDEAHLTSDGRRRSIGLAREVLPSLVEDGGGALVVSGSFQIKLYAGPTSDVPRLLAGLDRLEEDAAQVEALTQTESRRAHETADELERLNHGGSDDGESFLLKKQKEGFLRRLHSFQSEELSQAHRGFERFALALDRLAPSPAPRIAFYFGDTLRLNPGDHYFAVLRETPAGRHVFDEDKDDNRIEIAMAHDPFGANSDFNRLVALAATRGVRLYTVQARGAVASPSVGVRDAQSALVAIARETGGRAFLNGASADAIARQVTSDTACTYLLSFDGGDLPEDRPLPVTVQVSREQLKVSARGTIAVESRDARLRHERLSALYGLGARRSDLPLHAALIPLGYDNGKFSALAQVAAREVPVPDGEWSVGFSLVHDGAVEQEVTDRLHAASSPSALAMERTIEFKPGDYALVGIAQELSTELTSSDVRVGSWSDPRERAAVVTPIAILQPTAGAFLRKKESRGSGNLALAEEEPVRIGAPTAMVAVACRAPKEDRTLHVERRVEGEVAIKGFPPILLPPGQEPCIQIRDLIPPSTLGEGFFRYEIVVRGGDEVLARAARVFRGHD